MISGTTHQQEDKNILTKDDIIDKNKNNSDYVNCTKDEQVDNFSTYEDGKPSSYKEAMNSKQSNNFKQ